MLNKALEKHHNDSGVKIMKKEMLLSIKHRFNNIELNISLFFACLLNPCFKNRLLSGAIQQAEAKRMLRNRKVRKMEDYDMQDHLIHHQNDLIRHYKTVAKL